MDSLRVDASFLLVGGGRQTPLKITEANKVRSARIDAETKICIECDQPALYGTYDHKTGANLGFCRTHRRDFAR